MDICQCWQIYFPSITVVALVAFVFARSSQHSYAQCPHANWYVLRKFMLTTQKTSPLAVPYVKTRAPKTCI